ncbi:trehalose phosphate synthase [Selaginella moellendorffii]|uniref:alpha,alpha-trehalose-phosphate synthase (UDP-forming) n=1 Tax=Selaginella moellendorffii TaxID=88036 RepID=D8T2E5_SELML|nr:alpha,alpha-trehalose-phosphate synthase [UDP-forming] 1 isoform X1 [Selaginella moellendorffii]EFJ09193.1 trehalose phosphate synthase [Selaginella moellendorffii]|eukprot:XP_002989716.1 alpha,alpha-trehalose-phosphate synthase [UDP-forming] 1 isoform X1 [Selaginella moellendorffii]
MPQYPPLNSQDDDPVGKPQPRRKEAAVAAAAPFVPPNLNLPPSLASSRVERLVRERQLRRSERASASEDAIDEDDAADQPQEQPPADNISLEHQARDDNPPPSQQQQEDLPADQGGGEKQRLLVVANRLPVSATRKGDTQWSLEVSAGGLVSALLGVKQFQVIWIGWPGVYVQDDVGRQSLAQALEEKGFVGVLLDEATVDQYYNGYCNNVLWPLFHYIGLRQEDRLAATRSLQSQFNAYKRANQLFADAVIKNYQEGDFVWCHDYHLMVLPSYLKEYNSHMKVGWFLHTPFPSSEIYRTLPLRAELLQGVLAADLVGFHTYDYARHFVSACTRILGLEGTPEGVEDQGKITRVAAFPVGIDSERFTHAVETEAVKQHIQELSARFAGRKVMLGVDRLDMIKGIPQKLLAFEKFLEENPEWRDKVILVQIAVPTRTDVLEYQKLASQVHEIVGRINGRYGSLTTVPIHHLDRSMKFPELCALYAITDVLLVTSLRDGMNLVSYEFVACQNVKKGALVLSEFAGAAQSLGAGSILINPWNIIESANAIAEALNMPEEEREERHRHNFMHVTTHSAQVWAETFTRQVLLFSFLFLNSRTYSTSEMNDSILEAELRTLHIPPQLPTEKAIANYSASKNRLMILGFNSTLTAQVEAPRGRAPDQIREMKIRLHPNLKEVFNVLCTDPKTTIVILSGSERAVLDEAFGEFDMWLAAENGMFLRHTQGEWMTTMPEHLNMDWVESVQLVFEYFCERTPRSFVETRETSLVWNYKYADVEFGRVQARDMLQHLWTGPISNAAVDVVQGGKSVEVRPVGVSKGSAIDRILGEIVHSKHMLSPIDHVMCIGHFLSKDEDIYTFFEPELPFLDAAVFSSKLQDKRVSKSSSKHGSSRHAKSHPATMSPDRKRSEEEQLIEEAGRWEGSSVLDLKGENYFSCAVGASKRSLARYCLNSSDEVVTFLSSLAAATETFPKKESFKKSGWHSPTPRSPRVVTVSN